MHKTYKISEGEITSLVRRFYRANDFEFLSTSVAGEKLYYTLGGITQNNKQPDTIVTKDDIIILCEDKIVYSDLLMGKNASESDYNKLINFLTSPPDVELFRKKLDPNLLEKKIAGSLASISPPDKNHISILSESLLYISVKPMNNSIYEVRVNATNELLLYFTNPILKFDI